MRMRIRADNARTLLRGECGPAISVVVFAAAGVTVTARVAASA